MKSQKVRKSKVFKSEEVASVIFDIMTFRLDGLSDRAFL
jgi:hypothetical protein